MLYCRAEPATPHSYIPAEDAALASGFTQRATVKDMLETGRPSICPPFGPTSHAPAPSSASTLPRSGSSASHCACVPCVVRWLARGPESLPTCAASSKRHQPVISTLIPHTRLPFSSLTDDTRCASVTTSALPRVKRSVPFVKHPSNALTLASPPNDNVYPPRSTVVGGMHHDSMLPICALPSSRSVASGASTNTAPARSAPLVNIRRPAFKRMAPP